MKKKNINSAFLMIMLLLCVSFKTNGQEHYWHNSLFKLLKPDQLSKVKDLRGPDKFARKEEVRRLAINNINKHLEEVERLRALGKPEEDIRNYFNSVRKAAGTGSISGIIYESDGVTPIQNYISVWAFNEYGQYSGYALIFPNDNGIYVIAELSASNYYVKAEAQRYRNEYYDDATDWRNATLVPVTDGQETSSINFTLDSSEGEGAISGWVSSVDGTPLNDCYITAYDEDYNGANSSSTDENGEYVLDRLPSGGYKLRIHYGGSGNYVGEWYENSQSFETATIVTVTEPYTTKDINFILDLGGAIEGRVFDEAGEPVGAFNCYITAYDDDKNWVDSVQSDENGDFAISKLQTGIYRLRFEYYGQENYLDGWYDGAEDFENATPIVVTAPNSTENVDIALQAAGAISGSVFDYNGQPLAYCCVIAYDEHQDRVGGTQTGENGEYTILRLSTGRYKLFAEYLGNASIVGEEPANEWYDGEYEFEDAAFVEVTAPDSTENIDFSLRRGGSIEGCVYVPGGQLLSYSGFVDAYNLRGVQVSTGSILNDGRYFIAGLPTGDYKLRVRYNGEENYKDEWYNGKQNFETASPVSVTAPNMTPNIDFTLEYAGVLQGFVTNAEGNRLSEEDCLLQLYVYDANTGEYIDYNVNSFAGGYQFELLGRDYRLAAVSLYSNWMAKSDSLAAAYYENGTSFNDPNTQTISLSADTTHKLNDLVMEKVDGAISGTIYDGITGQPLTEGFYLVFAFDEDGYLVKASTYSESNAPITGEYQLCGLRPGNYYLLAVAGSDLFMDSLFQWYGGIGVNIDLETFMPKTAIPENASAVTVNEDLKSGIDFYFSIITLTSPNGGENWERGSSQNINWSSTGTLNNVKIEYSTNNGSTWRTIIDSTPNDGNYQWIVPNTPSTECLVRISDAVDSSIYDVSDAVFSITRNTASIVSLN